MMKMKLPASILLKELIKGRWMMAVASFYIVSCFGTTSIFGIYSGAIKKELHYNQETTDTLSFFKDTGANVGIIAGLMTDALPAWIVLSVGALMNLFGYLMMWLVVTHRITRPPTWHMDLYMSVAANSQSFANTAVMATFVKNFPQGRGEVLGVLKGFVGLSAAIFTQAYHAIYGEDSRGAVFLIALLPSLVSFIFMFFIRIMTPVYDEQEKRNFYSFLYLSFLIAVFLSIAIIVENVVNLPPLGYKAFGAMSVIMVISIGVIGVRAQRAYMKQVQKLGSMTDGRTSEAEMSIANEMQNARIRATFAAEEKEPPSCQLDVNEELQHTYAGRNDAKSHTIGETQPTSVETNVGHSSAQPTTLPFVDGHALGSVVSSSKPKFATKLKLFFSNWPQRGDDFTIPQALLSMDLWILLLSLRCGFGAALTTVDNMGQIGESLGYSPKSISTFVSLISIWNYFGRVGAGFGSEILLRRYQCARTLVLMVVLASACIGYILIAFPTTNSLYIASIIVGFCNGAQISLYVAIMSELFGLKYYATLQSLVGLTSPLGSYLLNVRVAGHLYDSAARRQHALAPGKMHGDLTCMGHDCFRLTFLIVTMVSGFGSLVSFLLTIRTRTFYTQDIYSKFNVKPDNEKKQCEDGH